MDYIEVESRVKRYLVFTYDHYYPSGGMNDFKAQTDNYELAKYLCDDAEAGHILDLVLGKLVYDTDSPELTAEIDLLKGQK